MGKHQNTILIVDDKANDIKLFEAMLQPEGYLTFTLNNGSKALQTVVQHHPDLILLDAEMPGIDSYRIAKEIKHNPATKNIPIILVTDPNHRHSEPSSRNNEEEEYIFRPVDSLELKIRVRNLLRIKQNVDRLKQHNLSLERRMRVRTQELHSSYIDTIFALTRAAEHRDDDTGIHVRRISHYCRLLSERLGMDSKFCEMIHFASPMHDIGKIGIPDHILLKPATHTADEFEIMKSHCTKGAAILFGFDSPYLKMGAEIALSHHERWNGTGYPAGLSGEGISQAARIMAICDVYDALRSKRPYKPAFEHSKTLRIIVDGDGRTMPEHFDPEVMDTFKQYNRHFDEIYQEYTK